MRQTVKPRRWICHNSDSWFNRHKWQYSAQWNGNNRSVLPFLPVEVTRGIARSGWRCYHCGHFVWDESDRQFALSVAHALGLIQLPGVEPNKLDPLELVHVDG